MRVLVTGGLGYIGGRFAQHLANQRNYKVVLGSRKQVSALLWFPQAQIVLTHWDSLAELEKICANIDVVVHMAGMNAQDCATDPSAAMEFNTVATSRLLRAAIQKKVKRFIYLSTAHVYGNNLNGVVDEETCPISTHPYATSHRAGEDIVRFAHQENEIEGVVIRLSNAFGAPVYKEVPCWGLVINDLCKQAVMKQSMALRSSGVQRRDFIPLSDVCRAVAHLLTQPVGSTSGVFNLGGEWGPTIWEIAELIQERCVKLFGFKPELTRNLSITENAFEKLNYKIDRLRSSGFEPAGDRLSEIDQLLRFCKDSFS